MSAGHKSREKPSKKTPEKPPVKLLKANKTIIILGGILLLGLVLRLLPALYLIVGAT